MTKGVAGAGYEPGTDLSGQILPPGPVARPPAQPGQPLPVHVEAVQRLIGLFVASWALCEPEKGPASLPGLFQSGSEQ
jgi:hypothetical protein